jgi:hypothetical protein
MMVLSDVGRKRKEERRKVRNETESKQFLYENLNLLVRIKFLNSFLYSCK